jgi:hypothetical protein
MESASSSEVAQSSSLESFLLEEATPFKTVRIASTLTVSSRHLSNGCFGDTDPRQQAIDKNIQFLH